MKTEATNFIVGSSLVGKKKFPKGFRGYHKCQRLFMSGCSWLRPSVGRRSLGQRPTPKHPARRTRGATSRTQGSQSLTTNIDGYTTRVLGCKNSVRLNSLNLFVISDKSEISFKDLSA